MAIDTVVELRLDTLFCHRADDGTFGGDNEPYLWTALIVLQNQIPFTVFPENDQFRVSIGDGMSNGDSASIPTRVGQLQVTFQSESIESRNLRILGIAVLLEDNGTSAEAIRAGFLAFKDQLLRILIANGNDRDAATAALKDAVLRAAEGAGSWGDWIKGIFGIGGDSLTGAAFLDTGNTRFTGGPKQIALEINDFTSSNWFTIGGAISVTPLDPSLPDPCSDFVLVLNQRQTALENAEAQLAQLQSELETASSTEKPRKLAKIANFERGPLKRAQDAVDLATSQLEQCRQTHLIG